MMKKKPSFRPQPVIGFGETSVDNSWLYSVLCEIADYCSVNELAETRNHILSSLDSLSLDENRILLPAVRH